MAAEGKNQHSITLGELCQAIEAGRVPYTISNGHYVVRAADVRHLRRFGLGASLGQIDLALPLATAGDMPAGLLDGLDSDHLDFSA